MAGTLVAHPKVQHIKVEDGKGKPLGRSFRVKLWPTLVFMRDGQVVSQLVRLSSEEIVKGSLTDDRLATSSAAERAFDAMIDVAAIEAAHCG